MVCPLNAKYDELPKLRPTSNFNEKVLKCHRTIYILHFPILMIFNVLCVWSRNMIAANINFLSCQNKIDHIMVMGCVINFETFRFKINKHFQNKHENFVSEEVIVEEINYKLLKYVKPLEVTCFTQNPHSANYSKCFVTTNVVIF